MTVERACSPAPPVPPFPAASRTRWRYWTGGGNLGSSSVVSTDETNKQATVSLRDGASVTFGNPGRSSIRPYRHPATGFLRASQLPAGLQSPLSQRGWEFDEANNSYIELAPWSRKHRSPTFTITGMVKRLKSFTYGRTLPGPVRWPPSPAALPTVAPPMPRETISTPCSTTSRRPPAAAERHSSLLPGPT